MNANTLSLPAGPELPDRWRAQASAQLAPGETLLGWMEVDLNTQLRFTAGVILLTDRRLLSQPAEQAAWHSWPLHAELQLHHHDHAGVGSLELQDGQQQLALWRYTLNVNAQALRLLAQWERQLNLLRHGEPAALAEEEELSTAWKMAV